MIDAKPLLRAVSLTKVYGGRTSVFGGNTAGTTVVDNVSFDIARGEILGLVGESGSGKTTIGRMVLRLEPQTSGEIWYRGDNISYLDQNAMRPMRKSMQAVFQDPYSALSPRMRVGRFVAEPFEVHDLCPRNERVERVAELFVRVGLDPAVMNRFPHQFSGGQRQRICIARALASNPEFIVADEPITALDVSIQAQIVNLFKDLQEQLGLTYLFIAHDLSMVRYLCHRVAVMMGGRIVEIGPTQAVFDNPQHDYTKSLLSAMPIPDPDAEAGRRLMPYRRMPFTDGQQLILKSPGHFVME